VIKDLKTLKAAISRWKKSEQDNKLILEEYLQRIARRNEMEWNENIFIFKKKFWKPSKKRGRKFSLLRYTPTI